MDSQKSEHSLRKSISNAFSTKLSLPKFITVAKLLTAEQRILVESIGFHHLLDIQCDSAPRGICSWVAKHFDVKSRSIQLPDGSKFSVTPWSIHQVLGIPIGGTTIVKKCDDSLKKLIADETSCKAKTPTINELKSLLTPTIVGDKFKRIFTLFAIGCFLFPTSYDCISSEYYSAVECPEQISSFDWCSAVLDKLTDSIEFYQRMTTKASTTALGGCILALVILYFELLDIPTHNHESVPRLKFWSTDMIKAFETLDAKDIDECIFGRLPLKDSSQTISLTSATTTKAPSGSTKMPSKCVRGSCSFKDDFASLSQDIASEIMSAIEPILSHHCDRLHSAWHCLPEAAIQDSLLPQHKVVVDHGKSLHKLESIGAYMDERTPQHLLNSKLVKHNKKTEKIGLANNLFDPSDDDATKVDSTEIILESMPHQVEVNVQEDKLVLEKTVEQRSVSKGHVTVSDNTTGSFLHVPTFSQDSSNGCSYDDSVAAPAHQAKLTDSSILQQDTFQLKPCISNNGKGMKALFGSHDCSDTKSSEIPSTPANENGNSSTVTDHQDPPDVNRKGIKRVFCSHHCSDMTSSEIPATAADENGNSSTGTDHQEPLDVNGKGIKRVFGSHHCSDTTSSEIPATPADKNVNSSIGTGHQEPPDVRTIEKATGMEEFDFFCHRLDSNFEVKPPTQADFSRNIDPMLSSSSTRKRPRSLNDAAMELYESRMLDNISGIGKSTNQSSSKADSNVDHGCIERENPMQSNSIEDIEDANLIDQVSQSIAFKPLRFHMNFTSTLVEKEVFRYIVDRIPFYGPRPRVVEIKKNWVDHKTFGLSMRVYGIVSSYVIDLMGKAVMTEEYEKNKANVLPSEFWYRHVVQTEKAKLLQMKDADAQELSKLFRAPNQGYRLDIMDMVFVPVYYDQFWYLVVANFRIGRFEVLIPNALFDEVKNDAETIILNFKRMFNDACPHSTKVHIWEMHAAYRSVTNSTNHCDSGIFVMKLIQRHDGDSQHLFKPEEAKTLRESLSYYLLTHPYNDKYDSLVDIKKILSIHGIDRETYN